VEIGQINRGTFFAKGLKTHSKDGVIISAVLTLSNVTEIFGQAINFNFLKLLWIWL
jgi:hypothetical protein